MDKELLYQQYLSNAQLETPLSFEEFTSLESIMAPEDFQSFIGLKKRRYESSRANIYANRKRKYSDIKSRRESKRISTIKQRFRPKSRATTINSTDTEQWSFKFGITITIRNYDYCIGLGWSKTRFFIGISRL